MGKQRRSFTPEYRQEAARLVIDTGRPISHVARELELSPSLLGGWVQQQKQRSGVVEDRALNEDERAELQRLRKEVAELRLDNELLSKASLDSIRQGNTGLFCFQRG